MMKVFYAFDCMLNGQKMEKNLSEIEIKILLGLLNKKLNIKTMVKFDNYIYDTFETFTKSKTTIKLNIPSLLNSHEKIRKVLVNPIRKMYIPRKEGDMMNLFKELNK